MAESIYLSVVLPSYNEMENIEKGVLDQVYDYLKAQKFSWEIILTDDGSSDGTLKKLTQFEKNHAHVRVLANAHRGKGPTVYSGMMEAVGKFRLFTDFDQATPIQEVEKLLKPAEQGYEVVVGSRELAGAKREREPFHRHLMGKVFNILVQLLTIQGIRDTQCGFKLLSARATQTLFPALYIYKPGESRQDSFTGAFDVELLYLARKKHIKLIEVPIFWKHIHTVRVSPFKDSMLMFIDLIRIRMADVLGKYKHS